MVGVCLAAFVNSNVISFVMQVLASLQPLDYMVVAFLPGFSEVSEENESCSIISSL